MALDDRFRIHLGPRADAPKIFASDVDDTLQVRPEPVSDREQIVDANGRYARQENFYFAPYLAKGAERMPLSGAPPRGFWPNSLSVSADLYFPYREEDTFLFESLIDAGIQPILLSQRVASFAAKLAYQKQAHDSMMAAIRQVFPDVAPILIENTLKVIAQFQKEPATGSHLGKALQELKITWSKDADWALLINKNKRLLFDATRDAFGCEPKDILFHDDNDELCRAAEKDGVRAELASKMGLVSWEKDIKSRIAVLLDFFEPETIYARLEISLLDDALKNQFYKHPDLVEALRGSKTYRDMNKSSDEAFGDDLRRVALESPALAEALCRIYCADNKIVFPGRKVLIENVVHCERRRAVGTQLHELNEKLRYAGLGQQDRTKMLRKINEILAHASNRNQELEKLVRVILNPAETSSGDYSEFNGGVKEIWRSFFDSIQSNTSIPDEFIRALNYQARLLAFQTIVGLSDSPKLAEELRQKITEADAAVEANRPKHASTEAGESLQSPHPAATPQIQFDSEGKITNVLTIDNRIFTHQGPPPLAPNIEKLFVDDISPDHFKHLQSERASLNESQDLHRASFEIVLTGRYDGARLCWYRERESLVFRGKDGKETVLFSPRLNDASFAHRGRAPKRLFEIINDFVPLSQAMLKYLPMTLFFQSGTSFFVEEYFTRLIEPMMREAASRDSVDRTGVNATYENLNKAKETVGASIHPFVVHVENPQKVWVTCGGEHFRFDAVDTTNNGDLNGVDAAITHMAVSCPEAPMPFWARNVLEHKAPSGYWLSPGDVNAVVYMVQRRMLDAGMRVQDTKTLLEPLVKKLNALIEKGDAAAQAEIREILLVRLRPFFGPGDLRPNVSWLRSMANEGLQQVLSDDTIDTGFGHDYDPFGAHDVSSDAKVDRTPVSSLVRRNLQRAVYQGVRDNLGGGVELDQAIQTALALSALRTTRIDTEALVQHLTQAPLAVLNAVVGQALSRQDLVRRADDRSVNAPLLTGAQVVQLVNALPDAERRQRAGEMLQASIESNMTWKDVHSPRGFLNWFRGTRFARFFTGRPNYAGVLDTGSLLSLLITRPDLARGVLSVPACRALFLNESANSISNIIAKLFNPKTKEALEALLRAAGVSEEAITIIKGKITAPKDFTVDEINTVFKGFALAKGSLPDLALNIIGRMTPQGARGADSPEEKVFKAFFGQPAEKLSQLFTDLYGTNQEKLLRVISGFDSARIRQLFEGFFNGEKADALEKLLSAAKVSEKAIQLILRKVGNASGPLTEEEMCTLMEGFSVAIENFPGLEVLSTLLRVKKNTPESMKTAFESILEKTLKGDAAAFDVTRNPWVAILLDCLAQSYAERKNEGAGFGEENLVPELEVALLRRGNGTLPNWFCAELPYNFEGAFCRALVLYHNHNSDFKKRFQQAFGRLERASSTDEQLAALAKIQEFFSSTMFPADREFVRGVFEKCQLEEPSNELLQRLAQVVREAEGKNAKNARVGFDCLCWGAGREPSNFLSVASVKVFPKNVQQVLDLARELANAFALAKGREVDLSRIRLSLQRLCAELGRLSAEEKSVIFGRSTDTKAFIRELSEKTQLSGARAPYAASILLACAESSGFDPKALVSQIEVLRAHERDMTDALDHVQKSFVATVTTASSATPPASSAVTTAAAVAASSTDTSLSPEQVWQDAVTGLKRKYQALIGALGSHEPKMPGKGVVSGLDKEKDALFGGESARYQNFQSLQGDVDALSKALRDKIAAELQKAVAHERAMRQERQQHEAAMQEAKRILDSQWGERHDNSEKLFAVVDQLNRTLNYGRRLRGDAQPTAEAKAAALIEVLISDERYKPLLAQNFGEELIRAWKQRKFGSTSLPDESLRECTQIFNTLKILREAQANTDAKGLCRSVLGDLGTVEVQVAASSSSRPTPAR